MRISKDEIESRRDLILEKGQELFAQNGYHATAIKDITGAAGIPKGSFFNYFETKEAFAVEVVRTYAGKQLMVYQWLLRNKSKSPIERLKALFDNRILAFQGKDGELKGCVLNVMSQEMAEHSSSISGSVESALEYLRYEIEMVLQEAQDEGRLGLEHDIKALALFIDNSWRGAMVVGKAMDKERALEVFRHYIFRHFLF